MRSHALVCVRLNCQDWWKGWITNHYSFWLGSKNRRSLGSEKIHSKPLSSAWLPMIIIIIIINLINDDDDISSHGKKRVVKKFVKKKMRKLTDWNIFSRWMWIMVVVKPKSVWRRAILMIIIMYAAQHTEFKFLRAQPFTLWRTAKIYICIYFFWLISSMDKSERDVKPCSSQIASSLLLLNKYIFLKYI